MIFLTPSGYETSTLLEESKKELGDNFQTLKHSDIALWLENILENKKYDFLHEENILFKDNDNKYIKDYRLLKSAMIQTIHNANMISGNTKELDMTKEKIQKLLETNLFNNNDENKLTTVEEIDEYIDIFNKVINLLDEKRKEIDIKNNINIFVKSEYIKKIKDYFILKNIQNVNELSQEKIIENIIKNNNSVILNIKVKYDVVITLETHYDKNNPYYISICTEKYKNEVRNLNNDINSVFNNFQQDEYWIYWAYIDTENKTPEEIAEVMINLYNLLKAKLQ